MCAQRSVVRVSKLVNKCLFTNNISSSGTTSRNNAVVAATPSVDNDRVNDEVAIKSTEMPSHKLYEIPAAASTMTPINDHTLNMKCLRCPVMKLSNFKRQIREYQRNNRESYPPVVEEDPLTSMQMQADRDQPTTYIASTPGYAFETLPFPLPLLPNVAKQIIKLQRQEEIRLLKEFEAEEKAKLAAFEEDEQVKRIIMAQAARMQMRRRDRYTSQEEMDARQRWPN